MIKVDNRKVISKLSRKSLRAGRSRNVIAIVAIALTAVMFTSIFTIAGTMVESFQQATFRQVGGDFHGGFKNLTREEADRLKEDPLIRESGARLMLGMPYEPPFNKAHVEVSYMEPAYAKHSFCQPTTGSLPAPGTREVATDTRVLKLLGITPALGSQVTLLYRLDNGTQVEDTFTLSGWWDYDPAGMASQVVVSEHYAQSVLEGYVPLADTESTGKWVLDVMFQNASSIEKDMKAVLANSGYQSESAQEPSYIDIGVNWGYMGAQISGNLDLGMIFGGAGLLLLVAFTGYLIIYNIFQISVTGDIRFYGLLKTLGATPRQIRRIIRRQGLILSLGGIPVGLVLGYLAGVLLAPQVMKNMSYTITHTSVNPLIFIGAAAFALATVLISIHKPGSVAGRVSPVEAVRYTDVSGVKAKTRKGADFKVWRMALANLGRNKKKTVLVVVSLALAVVLLQVTYTFAGGFDMDKYLRAWVVTDFILGDANYFQTNGIGFDVSTAVPEEAIERVNAQGSVTDSARIYGLPSSRITQEFVSEDYFRQVMGRWTPPEQMEQLVEKRDRGPDGGIANHVQLYGMEDHALDQIKLQKGDLSALHDPSQNAVAAVYSEDDYGKLRPDSHWAKVGDKVTVRYVDAFLYYDTRTGEPATGAAGEDDYLQMQVTKYRDVEYTVVAEVTLLHSMSYRYYGTDEFIMGSEVFQRDSRTNSVMTYLFDTEETAVGDMEAFLKDYTENVDPLLDYESKQSYEQQFYSFRSMFLLLGGVLSFIIGLVGVLNFFNAVMTSILTRRREFAMLQSVGMTGRQLKTMLVYEGIFYALAALLTSLVLTLVSGPVLGGALTGMFWFFTYQFSILPVALVTPVFLALGAALPLGLYRLLRRQSIVERLRQAE